MPQVLDALARDALRVAAAGALGRGLGFACAVLAEARGTLRILRALARRKRPLAADAAKDVEDGRRRARARKAVVVGAAGNLVRDLGFAHPVKAALVVTALRRALPVLDTFETLLELVPAHAPEGSTGELQAGPRDAVARRTVGVFVTEIAIRVRARALGGEAVAATRRARAVGHAEHTDRLLAAAARQ